MAGALVALLKRARMVRVRPISEEGKAQLRTIAGCCQACGSPEHRCDAVFELVGAPRARPCAARRGWCPSPGSRRSCRRSRTPTTRSPPATTPTPTRCRPSTWACLRAARLLREGPRRAARAKLCDGRGLRRCAALARRLRRTRRSRSGGRPTRRTGRPRSARCRRRRTRRALLERLGALQAAARGAPLRRSLLARTGCAEVWRRVDAAMGARCSTEATVLRRAGARARLARRRPRWRRGRGRGGEGTARRPRARARARPRPRWTPRRRARARGPRRARAPRRRASPDLTRLATTSKVERECGGEAAPAPHTHTHAP